MRQCVQQRVLCTYTPAAASVMSMASVKSTYTVQLDVLDDFMMDCAHHVECSVWSGR